MNGSLRCILTVFAVAAAYVVAFELNELLFPVLHYSTGVDLVFLPSGLSLLAVVTLSGRGAVGIALASCYLGLLQVFPDDPLTALGAGLVSGLAPWLARRFSMSILRISDDLAGLGPADLLKMTAMFAVVGAFLHQIWFVARGHSSSLLHGTVAMGVGDFLGALLVLYAARLALRIFERIDARRG